MIKLELNDLTNEPPATLLAVANFLVRLADPAPPQSAGALSTAAVAPLSTAPEVTPAVISTEAMSAFAPPAPTSVSAPAVAAPPPSSPAPSVDGAGLPWDHRIHSSARSFVADGTWRPRRGVSPEQVAEVKAELAAAMAVPTSAPVAVTSTQQVGAAIVPPPPAAVTFVGLMQRVSAAVNSGRMTQEQVVKAVQAVGLPSLPMLAARQDLVPAMAAELTRMGF